MDQEVRALIGPNGGIAIQPVRAFVQKQTTFNLWYLVIALLAVVWVRDLWVGAPQVQTIPARRPRATSTGLC